jgi:hypothetical protein
MVTRVEHANFQRGVLPRFVLADRVRQLLGASPSDEDEGRNNQPRDTTDYQQITVAVVLLSMNSSTADGICYTLAA